MTQASKILFLVLTRKVTESIIYFMDVGGSAYSIIFKNSIIKFTGFKTISP